jgi:hypothetical protein
MATIFGVCLFADVDAYPCVSDIDTLNPHNENDAKEISKHKHDWECNFIIEDSYHGNKKYHFVNSYIKNVDASISFIGSDGLVCRIPAPYYWIYRNSKN